VADNLTLVINSWQLLELWSLDTYLSQETDMFLLGSQG